MDETWTVLTPERGAHCGADVALTNCIESMISVCREHAGQRQTWRRGQMALRWVPDGMVEAASNSAASTVTCTYTGHCAPRPERETPELSGT